MSKNSIYEKIEESGRLEAEKILTEGTKKAQELHDSIISEMMIRIDELKKNAKIKNDDAFKSQITSSEQTAKQTLLAHKKNLIHSLFLEVLNKLLSFDDDNLKNYVVNRIKQASIEGNEIIRVNEKDYKCYSKVFSLKDSSLTKLNEILGENYNLKLSNEPVDISGGFIIEGKNFDIDYSFESCLKELEEEMEQELAVVLFEKDGE